MTERTIVFEKGSYWIAYAPKGRTGFEVFKIGFTHSTRCTTVVYEGQKGLDRAKAEIDRRIALDAV